MKQKLYYKYVDYDDDDEESEDEELQVTVNSKSSQETEQAQDYVEPTDVTYEGKKYLLNDVVDAIAQQFVLRDYQNNVDLPVDQNTLSTFKNVLKKDILDNKIESQYDLVSNCSQPNDNLIRLNKNLPEQKPGKGYCFKQVNFLVRIITLPRRELLFTRLPEDVLKVLSTK